MQGKTSSQLLRERETQILYASYAIQKQQLLEGCAGRIQILTGGENPSSTYTNIVEGAAYTTAEQQTRFLQQNTCNPAVEPTPEPPPPSGDGGSMSFAIGDYLSVANDTSLRIGSASFTIEWWQYHTPSITPNFFPRIFSIGSLTGSTTSIAVSLEDNASFYFWKGTSGTRVGNIPPQNQWAHVAVVGTGGTGITVYVNGAVLGTVAGAYNFTNSTLALRIGNETNPLNIANYTGLLTNFRWVVGTAVYTGTFTPPTAPLTAIAGTQLLLLATDAAGLVTDSSSAARTVTNTGVIFDSGTPF